MNLDFTPIGLNNDYMQLAVLCYDEPHRFYHNRVHLDDMLRRLFLDSYPEPFSPTMLLQVAAAIIYHDVVYNSDPGVDERASANLFRAQHSNARADMVEDVALAIESTCGHIVAQAPIDDPSNVALISRHLIKYDLWDMNHPTPLIVTTNLANLFKEWALANGRAHDYSKAFGEFKKRNIEFAESYSAVLDYGAATRYTRIVEGVSFGDVRDVSSRSR